MAQCRKVLDVVDEAGERHLRQICEDVGVRVEPVSVRTPDPALLFAVVGTLATVPVVLERWHDRLRGGQVIDLRPGARRVAYRTRDLTYGLVILHAVDGSATVTVHDPPNQTLEVVKAVLEAVGDMVGRPVAEVARAADAATGDRAELTRGDDTSPSGPA